MKEVITYGKTASCVIVGHGKYCVKSHDSCFSVEWTVFCIELQTWKITRVFSRFYCIFPSLVLCYLLMSSSSSVIINLLFKYCIHHHRCRHHQYHYYVILTMCSYISLSFLGLVAEITAALNWNLFWSDVFVWHHCHVLFEPPRDKTNKMACAPSEDSDQPSLISLHCLHEERLGP